VFEDGGEIASGITTAVHDAKRGRLFLHGKLSRVKSLLCIIFTECHDLSRTVLPAFSCVQIVMFYGRVSRHDMESF